MNSCLLMSYQKRPSSVVIEQEEMLGVHEIWVNINQVFGYVEFKTQFLLFGHDSASS
jgi:hypothetical protein